MLDRLQPITDCLHITGRTGRAGKTGIAITFLSNDDDEVMYDLKQGTHCRPTNSLEVKSLTFLPSLLQKYRRVLFQRSRRN